MLTRHLATLLFLLFALGSCDRIRHKSDEVAERVKAKTKAELREQTQKVVDKVFPPFDHDQPDTENNKIRFRDFIQVELSPDVRNIYCFDDAISIDADYMFAFNCADSTSEKIIQKHQLRPEGIVQNNGFGMQHDFPWWDKKRIATLPKYSWNSNERYFKHFWYDRENQQAYYFEFDL